MTQSLIDVKATLPTVGRPGARTFQNMAGGRLRRRSNKSRDRIKAASRHKRLYAGLKVQQQTIAGALGMGLYLEEGNWFFADLDTPGIGEATASGGVRSKGVPWGEGTAFHEWFKDIGGGSRSLEFSLALKVSREGTEGEYVVTEELQELVPDLHRITAQVSVDYVTRWGAEGEQ